MVGGAEDLEVAFDLSKPWVEEGEANDGSRWHQARLEINTRVALSLPSRCKAVPRSRSAKCAREWHGAVRSFEVRERDRPSEHRRIISPLQKGIRTVSKLSSRSTPKARVTICECG